MKSVLIDCKSQEAGESQRLSQTVKVEFYCPPVARNMQISHQREWGEKNN